MNTKLINNTISNINKYGLRIIGVLIIINFVITYFTKETFFVANGTWRIIFLFASFLISSYLHQKVSLSINAFIIILSIVLAFFVYPVLPIQTNYGENIFLLLSLFILGSLLPYLLYDITKQRLWIVGWLIVIFTIWVYAFRHTVSILDESNYQPLLNVIYNYPLLKVAYLGSWVFLQLLIYSYLTDINEKQNRIAQVNNELDQNVALIDKQNNELNNQGDELVALQQQLEKLNSGLEITVRSRTEQLQKQTALLKKYAFINSNLIRKPVEDLIKELDINSTNIIDTDKIKPVINDLDDITAAISDILNEQNIKRVAELEAVLSKKYGR